MARQLHLPLQDVSGVGRTFVSWLLAQWALRTTPTQPPLLFDADPFGGWAFRGKHHHSVFGHIEEQLNVRLLDDVIERVTTTPGSAAIVDPGAAAVREVTRYFLQPPTADVLTNSGCRMVIHLVLAGGTCQDASTRSALELLKMIPASARVVLWRNEFFERIDQGALEQHLGSLPRGIDARVDLPHRTTCLAQDLADLLSLRLTIDEAISNSLVTRMAAHRLHAFGRDLDARLACLS